MSKVGLYRLVQLLGQGTYARVYLALNSEEKRVALKVTDPELYSRYPKHLEKEYRIGKIISESCVSTPAYLQKEIITLPKHKLLPESWVNQVTLLIELEYLEGYSLSKYLKRRRRLNPEELWTLLDWLSLTIECIHSHHYVHGDLHLKNVYFTNKGYYLIDFGASCHLSRKVGQQKRKVSNCYIGALQSPDYYTLPILRIRRERRKRSKIAYLPEVEKNYFRLNDLYSLIIIGLSAIQPELFDEYDYILEDHPELVTEAVHDYRYFYLKQEKLHKLGNELVNLIVFYFSQLQFSSDSQIPELSIHSFREKLVSLRNS